MTRGHSHCDVSVSGEVRLWRRRRMDVTAVVHLRRHWRAAVKFDHHHYHCCYLETTTCPAQHQSSLARRSSTHQYVTLNHLQFTDSSSVTYLFLVSVPRLIEHNSPGLPLSFLNWAYVRQWVYFWAYGRYGTPGVSIFGVFRTQSSDFRRNFRPTRSDEDL